ncbi:hypothetical protein ON010_g11580 [Phytophthora cinnamomi]|nr:hypothetical protein ON010_g11580 [Phytophthora cinnamomi]
MHEYQTASERVLSRLKNVLAELQSMEREDQLPSTNSLESYTAIVTRFIRFLQLNHSKPLVYRVVRNTAITEELQQLNENVAGLFLMLLDVDLVSWETQWRADCFVQQAVLTAALSDAKVCLCGLQSPRARMEALLTLKFEVEKRNGRHKEGDMTRMKSFMGEIEKVSRMTNTALPSWFVPDHEVEVQSEPFARGSLGSVYHGEWGEETNVVVKRFGVDEEVLEEGVWAKIEKDMHLLFQLEHPNIVKVVGASHVGSPPFLIYKDAVNGNLRSFLARSENNKRHMWRLLYEAALGLQYLHQKGVVHGNLKLSNILVDNNDHAVLSDFGLGTLQICCTLSGTFASGSSVRWHAPESLEGPPTAVSDVYALAMCIIEASTRLPPFHFLSVKEVGDHIRRGKIPDKPDEIAPEVWGLVLLMTNADSAKRVTLPYVVEKLKECADRDKMAMRNAVGACSSCCAAISPGSRFCSQCGVPIRSTTQNGFQPHKPIQLSDSPAFSPDSSVHFLLHIIRVGSVNDQEQALMTLYQICFAEYRRKLVYNANGISRLVEIARHGRTYFLRVCALGILSWADIDLKFPSQDLESLRELVGATTPDECHTIASNVQDISNQSKTKAIMYCACVTDGENLRMLQDAGVVAPLIALLGSDDNLLVVCALGRLAADIESCKTMARNGTIDSLLNALRIGTLTEKEHSAWALSRLTVSTDCCKLIVEKGGIPLLVPLLHANFAAARFHGACVLGSLALISKENRSAIITHGAVTSFVELLQSENAKLKTRAACTLANLTVDNTNRDLLVRAEAITAFVALLQSGPDYFKGQATRALANLALDECHIDAITRAGTIPLVVDLLRSPSRAIGEAVRALANLSFRPESRSVIVDAGAIEPLLGLLQLRTDDMKEVATRTLANLALDANSRSAIASAGAIDLFVRQLDGGPAKFQSARALANLAVGEEYHKEIIRSGAVENLVLMLLCDKDNLKIQAALAFANLTMSGDTRRIVANAGAVLPLVVLLRDGADIQRDHALRALANIATEVCHIEIIKKAGAVPLFVTLLRSIGDKRKYQAVRAVRNMCAIRECRSEVIRSGAISPLIDLLRDGTDNQQYQAVCALASLAVDAESRASIVDEGGVSSLIGQLQDGSVRRKIAAAEAFGNLAVEDHIMETIRNTGAIPALVALLGSQNEKLTHHAVQALEKLCDDPGSCRAIVNARSISLVVPLLRSGTDEQKEDAARLLCHLSGDKNESHIFAETIPELITLVNYKVDAVKKYAVSTLANLADSDVNRSKIASEGGITPLVGASARWTRRYEEGRSTRSGKLGC